MMIGGINNGNGGNDILIGDGAETIRLLSDVFIEGVNQDDTEDLILVLDTVNEIIEYRDASTLVSYDLYEENSVVGFTSPTPSGDNSVAIGDGSTASGKRSVAIGSINDNDGFPAPVASNDNAIAIGDFAVSSGIGAITIGSNGVEASGDYALAMGFGAKAIGRDSIAMGFHASASGVKSVAIGSYALAPSSEEMALGSSTTDYIPGTGAADRLFNIGNGDNSDLSDAFTILKNGEVGIGSDNFEANTNGNMFQVWDGAGSLIGYVDDATGNWVPVSDERTKKDIQNLEHGLDAINQLRPTSYKFKRNDAPAIGFIAQEIMEIIPEVVVGSEDTQYGVSYAALTPVLTKAIQELDIKITESEVVYALKKDDERTLKKILQSILDSVTSLVLDTVESVQGIFQKVETEELQVNDKLCVGDICVTEADFKAVFEDNSSSSNNKSETNSQDTSNESEEESTPDQEAEITEEESGNNEEEAEEESTPESESEPETESEPEPIPEPEFTSTEE